MTAGDVLAEKRSADPEPAHQNCIVLDYGLGFLATEKPSPDTHRIRIEITDIQDFLIETIQNDDSMGIRAERSQLERHGGFIDIVVHAESHIVVPVIEES